VTDVSIYVALITGATGAVAAATPQLFIALGESKEAKRARRDRVTNARQQAYVELLGAAAELRTRVENTSMYGGEILARLAEIRESAADVQVKAAKVGFLKSEMAQTAKDLGSAAADLATEAVAKTNMTSGVMTRPDAKLILFDQAVDKFKSEAVADTANDLRVTRSRRTQLQRLVALVRR
jgi:TolA-binding protein